MIPISELKYLEKAFFDADLKYHKPELYRYLELQFSEEKPLDHDTLGKIEQLKAQASDHFAHNALLREDLAAIRKQFHKNDLKFDEQRWIKQMPVIHKKIEQALGLKFTPKAIHFVDHFPKGHEVFETRGASAITIFEGMEGAGIYFLNRRVDMVSTAIHIIHEQIHTCLSQNKDKSQLFIEWFEEGVAIFFSLALYYDLTKDLAGALRYRTRSFIYSKVKPEWEFTKRYFEYMKIMSAIFLAGGKALILKTLKQYLKKDRKGVAEQLRLINAGKLKLKHLPKDDIEQLLATFSTVVEPELVTPLEYRIIDTLSAKPQAVEDLAKAIAAPVEVTKQSLNSLFAKNICIITKENALDLNWRKRDLFDEGLLKPVLPAR